ncbi:MAG TPA: GtrA family protein [Polyangiaceae bacterium]
MRESNHASRQPRFRVNAIAREFLSLKFVQFLFAGGVAALANITARYALSSVFSYPVSIVCAYMVGMTVAYGLNRKIVFGRGDSSLTSELAWFVLVNGAGVLQTLVVSLVLSRLLDELSQGKLPSRTIAHVVGVAVPAFTSFLGHKYLTFRKERG